MKVSADWKQGDERKRTKRIKPKRGDKYWIVGDWGYVIPFRWIGHELDLYYAKFGNCFCTKREAQAARKRVMKALFD